jgi:hypothetical protein
VFPYEGLQIADPIESQNEPQFESPEPTSQGNLPVLEQERSHTCNSMELISGMDGGPSPDCKRAPVYS